ncbi:MAG: hypothetical protein Q9227_008452 [Pyrenula ochraceoflavens]
MAKLTITIVSDIVCPWCYIGHARLTRAISTHQSLHPADTFHLTYHPFYLNPAPPVPLFPPSKPRQTAYAEKFGPARAQQIFQYVGSAAHSAGLNFKFGGMTGPSRNGHRLVHYAKVHGGEDAQNKTMLGLWRRYFEEEKDITRLEVLVETGVEAGLGTAEEVKGYLEGGEDVGLVDGEAEEASFGMGISGVPHYTVNGKWEVSGGQEPEVFLKVFEKARGEGEGEGEKMGMKGEVC